MTKQSDLLNWLNKYLTKQFICDPKELPDDECLNEAKEILSFFQSQGAVRKTPDGKDPIINMDIYPKSVIGGEKPYKRRNQYQNGWNAALVELAKSMAEDGVEYVEVEPLIPLQDTPSEPHEVTQNGY